VTQDARDDYGMYPSLSQTCRQRVAEIMPTADYNVQLLAGRMYVAPESIAVVNWSASPRAEDPLAASDPKHTFLQFRGHIQPAD